MALFGIDGFISPSSSVGLSLLQYGLGVKAVSLAHLSSPFWLRPIFIDVALPKALSFSPHFRSLCRVVDVSVWVPYLGLCFVKGLRVLLEIFHRVFWSF